MDNGFIGEIRALALPWTPQGWLLCDGSTYQVNQYQALYAVISNLYGGTAGTNFMVPDLRGKVLNGTGQLIYPGGMGSGATYVPAGKGGADSVQLSLNNMAPHNHSFNAANNSTATTLYSNTTSQPANGSFLTAGFEATSANPHANMQSYINLNPDTSLAPIAISPFTGGTAAHENRQPYLTLSYCICWQGIYPVRS